VSFRYGSVIELGIHKATLFRKIKKIGLTFEGKDGRADRKGKKWLLCNC